MKNKKKLLYLLSLSLLLNTGCTNNKYPIKNSQTIDDTIESISDLTTIDDIIYDITLPRSNNSNTITLRQAINNYEYARENNDFNLCNMYEGYMEKIILCAIVLNYYNIDVKDLINFNFDSTSATITYKNEDSREVTKRVRLSGFINTVADNANMAYNHNYNTNMKQFDKVYENYIKLLISNTTKKSNEKKLVMEIDPEKYSRIK